MAEYGIVLGPDEDLSLVTQRGPVQDPNSPGESCFFSEKLETAQLLGYDAGIVANHHTGAGAGAQPDAFICGSQGHDYTPTAPGVCIGHRLMHLLFGYPEDYTVPYPVPPTNEPQIGDLGESIAATAEFDGWGHVRFHNANTLEELDTYSIPEAVDEAYASGFGDLTVHEVAMEKKKSLQNLAYFAWYNGGFRVARYGGGELNEVGFFIDEGGNNFWGVELGGFDSNGERLILASDRDFGLYIFRYTGP
jgi:hypothetical protein